MTTPAPPANGDTVALIGLVSTTLLRKGEVKNFIWSAFYAAFVTRGYAQVYSGSSGGAAPAAFYVKSVNGSRPDPAGNVDVAGGGVTNPALAAIVAASGATRDAVDARAKAVGDNNYASVDDPRFDAIGGGSPISVVDNGNGTITINDGGSGALVDNGNGTATLTV